jgi:glycosyltransferase involved in cell wall biosynthesis
LRVAHLVAGNLFGGVETILVTLARYRSAAPDMVPLFVACYEGRLSEELARLGERVHLLGGARASRPLSVLRARHALKSLLVREQIDAVVCHGAWPHALFGATVNRSGVPLVFYQHDVLTRRHWIERWASLQTPRAIVANSRFTARSTSSVFASPAPRVLYCPVPTTARLDPAERARLRAELGVSDDKAVIIQTSRMEPWKGHRRHVRVLASLREREDWTSIIVGGAQRPHEQRYLSELGELARELRIDSRVTFLGQRSDVPRLLGAADIHFQPNDTAEPFGIAFIEAMLAGLPVVTRPLGAIPEFVTSDTGCLADSEADLARAIGELLDAPQARRKLGENAHLCASELCHPEKRVRELEAFMKHVASSPGTFPA